VIIIKEVLYLNYRNESFAASVKQIAKSRKLFLCTVLLTGIFTSTYSHKEKIRSTTVGLIDLCSDQHRQGTRSVIHGQIPWPNTKWILKKDAGTSNIFSVCTRHTETSLIYTPDTATSFIPTRQNETTHRLKRYTVLPLPDRPEENPNTRIKIIPK
jgi:hypothetical protein